MGRLPRAGGKEMKYTKDCGITRLLHRTQPRYESSTTIRWPLLPRTSRAVGGAPVSSRSFVRQVTREHSKTKGEELMHRKNQRNLSTHGLVLATLLVLTIAGSQPAAAKDLMAHFPFDVDATDESGNGNDGTEYSTSTDTAIVADGLVFNGSCSYVSFPDLGIFDGSHSW